MGGKNDGKNRLSAICMQYSCDRFLFSVNVNRSHKKGFVCHILRVLQKKNLRPGNLFTHMGAKVTIVHLPTNPSAGGGMRRAPRDKNHTIDNIAL